VGTFSRFCCPGSAEFVECESCWQRTTKGYFGVAVGKGARTAKTEIEKLKLSEMTVREAVKEAAKMYVSMAITCLFAAPSARLTCHKIVSIQCTTTARTNPLNWS